MVRITGSKDCGNSPKNAFVQEVAVALESGDRPEGMFARGTDLPRRDPPEEIVIDHAIAHGKVGAASGVSRMPGGAERRFAYVVEFTSAKAAQVARVQAYG